MLELEAEVAIPGGFSQDPSSNGGSSGQLLCYRQLQQVSGLHGGWDKDVLEQPRHTLVLPLPAHSCTHSGASLLQEEVGVWNH